MKNRYRIQQICIDDDFIDYVGCTTITGIPDKPYLKQWAADMAIDYIFSQILTQPDNAMLNAYYDFDKIDKTLLKIARYAHKNILNKTADIGKELHILVATYINLVLKNENAYDFINHISNNNNQYLNQMFLQFLVWQKKNVKRYIESEKPVCNRELFYAGTLDFIYEGFDGKIYCVDLKTNNIKPKKKKNGGINYKLTGGVYPEHEMQVVAYKYARESIGVIIDENRRYTEINRYLVQFNQDGNTWEKAFEYPLINIDYCGILRISRDYFNLEYKIVKDIEYKMKAFEALLTYYYVSAKRKINNTRGRERR